MHPQHPQPAPRRKSRLGCWIAAAIAAAVVIVAGVVSCTAVVVAGGDPGATRTPAAADSPTADAPSETPTGSPGDGDTPSAEPTHTHKAKPKPTHHAKPKVKFTVTGDAPGGVDIMYGSDSDNRQGGGMPWSATLPLHDDALYYSVTAQLQGGGDITCKVQIGDQVKTGHASGGYNICSAQLNSGVFGGWESVTGARPGDGGPWQRIGARVAAEGVKAARR